ncbi:hypothetical protein ACH5RR_015701 [Cinchona calisaya]|uniref:At1g61320/AtMIF1 LRR domain-containing protein n=1 Tax=Cinchona calisaya TaxID=153742 RepID=A0ABD2ZTX1_9GENT
MYESTRKVQRLELNFSKSGIYLRRSSDPCYFPNRFLSLRNGLSAEQSYLDSCGIQLPEFYNLRSLGTLCLICVNITAEAIEFFLHNCPFLERLELVSSGKLVNLVVSSSSLMLKHFVIERCQDVKLIQICNSNVVSLSKNLILINVPKLTEVTVALKVYRNWSSVFSQLSCCLSWLEKFSLKLRKVSEFPESSKLKYLRTTVGAWEDHSLVVLTSMIKACLWLEIFV